MRDLRGQSRGPVGSCARRPCTTLSKPALDKSGWYHRVALLDKLDAPELRIWYEGSGPPDFKLCHLVFGSRGAQRTRAVTGPARYDQVMSGVPADLPPGSAVVLTNPDEDASPEAFRAFIDELLAGPEPELESVEAAEALRALRVDAEA
jgi:hypothetical protein